MERIGLTHKNRNVKRKHDVVVPAKCTSYEKPVAARPAKCTSTKESSMRKQICKSKIVRRKKSSSNSSSSSSDSSSSSSSSFECCECEYNIKKSNRNICNHVCDGACKNKCTHTHCCELSVVLCCDNCDTTTAAPTTTTTTHAPPTQAPPI
jgi:hypothetical protein